MTVALTLAALLAALQVTPTCRDAQSVDPASAEFCLGEAARQRAEADKSSENRRQHLAEAVAHYQRAIQLNSDSQSTLRNLRALVGLYDYDHLRDLAEMTTVVRDLRRLAPQDLEPVFKLSAFQEALGLFDAAEATLLDGHRDQPESVPAHRMLAQFYARRVLALTTTERSDTPDTPDAPVRPGEPDERGVYSMGGGVEPPRRAESPVYPPAAKAAGVQGNVELEVVIDPQGAVQEAQVVRSIPLLDEAAIEAVRNWRFKPALVDGKPVPVRTTITVNFTTR